MPTVEWKNNNMRLIKAGLVMIQQKSDPSFSKHGDIKSWLDKLCT
jgi:hypothetical protein